MHSSAARPRRRRAVERTGRERALNSASISAAPRPSKHCAIHWVALKANYGPLLEGLEPLVAEHPKHPSGVTYRLVVGPLANAAEAASFCARFPLKRTGCHAAKFSGAQLALH